MFDEPAVPRVFDFVYADETYRIELLDAERLRWERIVGGSASDTERYVASRLDADEWLITWIEADGLGLSSVIDFATGRLVTHANQGRDVFVNAGTVRPG